MIDESGQRNFSKALAVTKQIFNSLTEYIQVIRILSSYFIGCINECICERNLELQKINVSGDHHVVCRFEQNRFH